ncbi:hypothetical protein CXK91_21060 [Stutzerimonas stutzeri]|uniref:Uncharacterized protein n=1 Tax=Stutzerimonas stutzeri TaxID=316 RepID=A0A2S4AHY3_STUST|nr:hypothetical protein [Stutzerimonas stutzeri]MCQ4264153.1 hypothetical protein [Stutzerimonas stutzeri]POH81091.1 hypothetical protein CXK91_21060 [Stutzerimonas stutzeri]
MIIPRSVAVVAAVLLIGIAQQVAAHQAPFCQCKAVGERTVRCVGGFSGGVPATGVTLDVIDYDERILVAGKLDEEASFTFERPETPFYILFDAGPGYTVEIDHRDL